MSGFRERLEDCGVSVRENFAKDPDKGQPWMFYKDPLENMTDYEYENFDKLMKPTNFGEPLENVDISGAAEWLENNFDMLLKR